ncbi:MAG: molybdopterin-dependent oxidoreductase [Acidobacteriota bacterium]
MFSAKMQKDYSSQSISFEATALDAAPDANIFPGEHSFQSIPGFNSESYRLTVDGLVIKRLSLTLDDIHEDFPKVNLMAPFCRDGVTKNNQLAKWGGIRLRHLLLATGIKPEATHVVFLGGNEGLANPKVMTSAGAIPIKKALHPEVLLAYEMNGEPLTRMDGYPLRVIIPNDFETSAIKWINEIQLLTKVEQGVTHSVAHSDPDNEVRVIISRPRNGDMVFDDVVVVEGYAIASNGKLIRRVEVTSDSGKSWKPAKVHKNYNPWVWSYWDAHLKLSPGTHKLIVRAFDEEGNQTTTYPSIKLKVADED